MFASFLGQKGVSRGENIYPAEIEAVIVSHPAVLDVTVTGKPDAKWGEAPVAFVVKKQDTDLDGQDN